MTDNITLPRATVQQALEALEELDGLDTETECVTIDVGDVIAALKAALGYWDIGEDNPDSLSKHPAFRRAPQQQAEPVQEPFDDLATELFVVAQISPADDGFSDTIDRIESWLREHFSTPPQRKPLTMQPIVQDKRGVFRFKKNGLVDALYEHGVKTGLGMNELHCMTFTDEDRQQFAQLIGYSVSGYSSLSYVSDEAYEAAEHFSTQPQRKPLTEAQQVDCLVKSGCIGTVKMSFESGPYDITRPSINASMLIEAVEAAHGIK